MANFTEDGNATITLNQTTILPAGRSVFWLFLFAINIVLSFTAFLGNAMILIALRKVSSLHPPSKLLFGCLAVTDLGVGLISQPLFAIYILGHGKETNWNIYIFTYKARRASTMILCGVSLFTSTTISVDRLLALLLGLSYRQFVTLTRVRAVIFFLGLTTVSLLLIPFFFSVFVTFIAGVILVPLSLVISVFSYTKIFLTLRQQQAQVQSHVQGQPNERGMPLNLARYEKTVSSIAWVQLALLACYVPYIICVMMIWFNEGGGTAMIVLWRITETLVYFNSSLNPLLYCWKIKEVRQAVKDTIKQFCYCFN